MKIYLFSKIDGSYIGPVEALPDPTQKKGAAKQRYLIPRNATTVPPDPDKKDQYFIDGKWIDLEFEEKEIKLAPKSEKRQKRR